MKIHRFNPDTQKTKNTFWIQSHGYHAGRPLREPIPNSWQIETKNPRAFELCFMLYKSRFLKNHIRGSVIPFIALHEYRKILNKILANPVQTDEEVQKKLKGLTLSTKAIEEQQKKLTYFLELQNLFASELLKTFSNDF
jgi:hypothetical protein